MKIWRYSGSLSPVALLHFLGGSKNDPKSSKNSQKPSFWHFFQKRLEKSPSVLTWTPHPYPPNAFYGVKSCFGYIGGVWNHENRTDGNYGETEGNFDISPPPPFFTHFFTENKFPINLFSVIKYKNKFSLTFHSQKNIFITSRKKFTKINIFPDFPWTSHGILSTRGFLPRLFFRTYVSFWLGPWATQMNIYRTKRFPFATESSVSCHPILRF